MDSVTLTSIVQALVTIISTLGGIWAMFNKQNASLEKKLGSRISNVEYQLKQSNLLLGSKLNSSFAIHDEKK